MKSINKLILLILCLALILTIPGCAQVLEKVETMKPEVREVVLQWGEVTAETTEVLGTIRAYNPNSFSIPVEKITCGITLDGIKMADAETGNLSIAKSSEFPINISAKIDNKKIPAFWTEHIRQNEKSEAIIDIGAIFDLKVTKFTFPFQLKRPIETDLLAQLNKIGPTTIEKKLTVPFMGQEQSIFKITLDSVSGEWGNVSSDNTDLNLSATIQNENSYPLPVPKLVYDIKINGIPLAVGESDANYILEPNATNDINTTINLNTGLMDQWFVTHIQQGEKSVLDIEVSLIFELPEDVEQLLEQDTLIIPVWESSQEFETNILGTK